MDDWEVVNSDEEDGVDYQPQPELIVKLFNQINSGELPRLQTVIHPREKLVAELVEEKTDFTPVSQHEAKEIKKSPTELMEFDFDSQTVAAVKKFTPKRTPNRPQQKKVARMDSVCSNIIKYKKLDEEQMQKEKKKSST